MKCPLLGVYYQRAGERLLFQTTECQAEQCAWWDEKKKQCAILTLAQNVNFNVRVAR